MIWPVPPLSLQYSPTVFLTNSYLFLVLFQYKKTPTRSPSGQFHTLPSLDDAQLQSPGGIFLSPHPPTPQQYKSAERSFDHEDHKEEKHDDIKQEKIRDYSKDKFALTPTNFSVDYGKGDFGSLDTSNGKNASLCYFLLEFYDNQLAFANVFLLSLLKMDSPELVTISNSQWAVFSWRRLEFNHEHTQRTNHAAYTRYANQSIVLLFGCGRLAP